MSTRADLQVRPTPGLKARPTYKKTRTIGVRMNEALGRRLLGNLSAQAATFALSTALGLTTTVVLARTLGPEGFGGFRFLFAFIYFFQAANDLGINTTLVRSLAQAPDRANQLVQNTLGFKVLLALASMAVAWMAAAWWPGFTTELRWSVALFAVILPIQAMTLPIVTLQANVQIARASIVEVFSRVTGFVGLMIAVTLGYGLLAVTGALIIGEIAGLAAVLVITRRFVVPVPAFDVATWKEVLRSSIPLGMSGLLASLVIRADFILLQVLLGPIGLTVVGYYATAYQVTSLFEKVPQFVMATLYPVMSRLAGADPVALVAVYWRAVRHLTLIGVVVAALVIWLAPLAVWVLAGDGYEAAVLPLRILVLATACLYPAIVAGNLLIALGKAGRSLRLWAVAAPVNILLNLVLIPRYGAAGAATATFISFFIVFVGAFLMARQELHAVVTARH